MIEYMYKIKEELKMSKTLSLSKYKNFIRSLNLSSDDLLALQKASAIYSLPDLTFFSEEGSDTIKLILRDKENDTSNTYDLTLAGSTTGTFSLDLKIENIRVLPGDYTVKVSKHLISEWTNTDVDLTYYIALEP